MNRASNFAAGIRQKVLGLGFPAVIIGALDESPDSVIGLIPYPLDDDMDTGTSLSAVQVVIRGSANGGVQPVLEAQEVILQALGTVRMDVVGGVPVSAVWRQMSAPLSPDPKGRPEVRDTYYLRSDRLGLAG